jgi:mRNA interferase RelE/StbE
MKLRLSAKAEKDYRGFDGKLKDRIDKQFNFLLSDVRHPSLHAKKYDESKDVWQGRIDRNYRFYFTIEGDTIIPHPK